MKGLTLHPGRRARQLIPAIAATPVQVPALADDMRLFAMTFVGGLVFFGTYLG